MKQLAQVGWAIIRKSDRTVCYWHRYYNGIINANKNECLNIYKTEKDARQEMVDIGGEVVHCDLWEVVEVRITEIPKRSKRGDK